LVEMIEIASDRFRRDDYNEWISVGQSRDLARQSGQQ